MSEPTAAAVPSSERIAAELRELILSGELRPGEWIRQEEFAERFGVSRVPVREALRILEIESLTEHVPNRGARVPLLSNHEVSVIYQMRERLEPLALLESVPNLNADDWAELDQLQQAIEANDNVDTFLRLDREFHLRTYSGCALTQVNSIVTRLWNSTQFYRRAYLTVIDAARVATVNAEHRLLLDAIVRRDLVDAERYLVGHIRRTRVELERLPNLSELVIGR